MPTHDKSQNINSGLPEQDGLDDVGRAEILRRLAPRQVNLVGNLADVQRGFGQVAAGESSNVEDGVEVNATPEQLKESRKQLDAANKAIDVLDKTLTTTASEPEKDNSLDKKVQAKASTDLAAQVNEKSTTK